MSVANFIPEVWAAGVITAFTKDQVVIPSLNTAYTGDATRGNTVNIISAVTPTITDYKLAGRIVEPEDLDSTTLALLIDQEKAFSVYIDDIDKAQAAGSFDDWVSIAGRALGEDAESTVLAALLAGAGTNAQADTPVAVTTSALALDAILAIREAMAKSKVPTAGRYIAVNPAMATLLISGLASSGSGLGEGELRNGQVARLYGMTILETPLFAEAAKPVAVGYHEASLAFVQQINTVESSRAHDRFSDILKGLSVYGAKVVLPTAVVKYVSA
jgi:hypothetical protein